MATAAKAAAAPRMPWRADINADVSVEVDGQQVILNDVDTPYCSLCEQRVHTVYRQGTWCCSVCGLCFAQEIEGTGGLRTHHYEDDNLDGQRTARVTSESYADMEHTLGHVHVDEAVHTLPTQCTTMVRALQLPPSYQARARQLAERWLEARRAPSSLHRRMPPLEYAVGAVIYYVRLERNIPLTEYEVMHGAAGVSVYKHTWTRLRRHVAAMCDDLHLSLDPLALAQAFVTRFVNRSCVPREAEDCARTYLVRRARLVHPDVVVVALLSLRGREIDRSFIQDQKAILGPEGVRKALAAAVRLGRPGAEVVPPGAAPRKRSGPQKSKD